MALSKLSKEEAEAPTPPLSDEDGCDGGLGWQMDMVLRHYDCSQGQKCDILVGRVFSANLWRAVDKLAKLCVNIDELTWPSNYHLTIDVHVIPVKDMGRDLNAWGEKGLVWEEYELRNEYEFGWIVSLYGDEKKFPLAYNREDFPTLYDAFYDLKNLIKDWEGTEAWKMFEPDASKDFSFKITPIDQY